MIQLEQLVQRTTKPRTNGRMPGKTLGRNCMSVLSFGVSLRRNADPQISPSGELKAAMRSVVTCALQAVELLRRLSHETDTNRLVVVDTHIYRIRFRTASRQCRTGGRASAATNSNLDSRPRGQHHRKTSCRGCRSDAGREIQLLS
jgi:hypothetical protein